MSDKDISNNQITQQTIEQQNKKVPDTPSTTIFEQINWKKIAITIYIIVSLVLIVRLFIQLVSIFKLYITSKTRKKIDHLTILYNPRFKNTFSFFRYIFINVDFNPDNKLDEIIIHEKIHASQLHSIDLLIIELLAAVMWFNPIVWMIRKELQLIHEYLADEGVLSTGIDRLKYQALLLNQVTEDSLISLSSSFNHSLIKKRMIMMTKQKFNQTSKLKILALAPLTAIMFLSVACINGQNKSKTVTAVQPVRMNVLYIGVDNPVRIAASGYAPEDLDATINNGTITGSKGEYIIRPEKPGSAIVKISSHGKEIQETSFRVKTTPDPIATIAGINKGSITKEELLKQSEIVAMMQNFDFDISFDIVSFSVSMMKDGYVFEQTSQSNKITSTQKELFKKLNEGNRFIIEDIKCKGPDGKIRELPVISLAIKQ